MNSPLRAALILGAAASLTLVALPAQAAGSGFQLDHIQYDSPGSDDRSNTSLNNEFVEIRNVTSKTYSLTGWTLKDRQGHVYTFPKTTVEPGAAVRVRTGSGTDSGRQRYQNSGNYIWNNDGDKAVLRRADGSLADTCSWGEVGTSKDCRP